MKIKNSKDFLKYGAEPTASTRGLDIPIEYENESGGFFSFCWKSFKVFMAIRSLIFRTLSILIGALYPAYKCYKAIKTNDKEAQREWLMYASVYFLYTVVEYFAWPLLQFFPFYFEVKCIILVALIHPEVKGASRIYKKFVAPSIETYEKIIDDNVDKVTRSVEPGLQKVTEQVNKVVEDVKKKSDASADGSTLKKATEALTKAQDAVSQKASELKDYMDDTTSSKTSSSIKNTASKFQDNVSTSASSVADKASAFQKDAAKSMSDQTSKLKSTAEDAADDLTDAAGDMADQAQDVAEDLANQAQDAFEGVTETMKPSSSISDRAKAFMN